MSKRRTREQAEDAIQRGADARVAFDEGVIGEAFQFVENSALERARTARTPGESYDATLTLQVLTQVRGVLTAFVSDGERAARELESSFSAERERRNFEMKHANYLSAAREARSTHDHFATATREGNASV